MRAENALHFIYFGTVVLLFSMMLVVSYLHLAGFFDWVTELVVTRLKPYHLLPSVIFLSGLLSAFFVNDIICLVMVPFVLKVIGRMGIKPIPYLLAVATASNIGSSATITGNPQNILIGSCSQLNTCVNVGRNIGARMKSHIVSELLKFLWASNERR